MLHSHLRVEAAFEPFSAHTTAASFPHSAASMPPRPERRQRMGIASTYRLAHRARGKLSGEAARGDHDLRLLVGHANLLDSLMLDLQEAERDQQAWFNQTVTVVAPPTPAPAEEARKVQWSDNVVEQHRLDVPDASDDEDDEEIEEEVEDSEDDEESLASAATPALPVFTSTRRTTQSSQRRARSPPARRHVYDDEEEQDSDEDMESDDEYDDVALSLVRTRSHSANDHDAMAVPELVHDSSDSEDDESAPVSPTDAMDIDAPAVVVKDFATVSVQQKPARLQKTFNRVLDALREEDEGEEQSYFAQPQHGALVAAY